MKIKYRLAISLFLVMFGAAISSRAQQVDGMPSDIANPTKIAGLVASVQLADGHTVISFVPDGTEDMLIYEFSTTLPLEKGMHIAGTIRPSKNSEDGSNEHDISTNRQVLMLEENNLKVRYSPNGCS